jgi:hypothetical protein
MGGSFLMGNPDAYRRYASECLQMASAMNDPQSRAMLLQMAQVWLRLAGEKDPACNVTEGQTAINPAVQS